MSGGRGWGRFWVVVCGVFLAVAAVVLWHGLRLAKLKFGDVDPAGAILGLIALTAALWAGWQAAQAQRVSDTDMAVWADRLAQAVWRGETRQREQLLGVEGRTIDVGFVLVPAPAHNAQGAKSHGTLAGVVGYFRDLWPQRLVITGAPGSGKTVLAIELILGLLEQRAAADPVPVRISAAGWDPQTGVRPWLIAHLVQTFGLREVTARALVEAHRVLPVIDGLDEMDCEEDPGYGSLGGAALRALNHYQDGRDRARLVLTCRTGQYQALTAGQTWARDAARVDLAPVTPDQASTFIDAVAGTDQLPRWRPVLHAFNHPGHPLAQALATPWRLTLAVTVYQEQHPETGVYLRDPADLTGHTSADQIRDHLLESFIPAATAAATVTGHNPNRYRPDRVRAWLTVLARYLTTNTSSPPFAGRALSSTDIVLHELWPLAGDRPRILANLLTTIALLAFTPLIAASRPVWIAGLLLLTVGLNFVSVWSRPWPQPTRIDLAQLKTRSGRRKLAGWLTVGLAVMLAFALALGLAGGPAFGLALGLAFGLAVGLAGGLATPGIQTGMDPRAPVRNDLTGWLAFGLGLGLAGTLGLGLAFGLASGLAFGFTFWLAGGLALMLAGGPADGLAGGLAGMRYLMLMIVMHGRLPRRLGRFLDWCYTAGLIRTAGIAYQFRHRELQDHLAATALNPPSGSPGTAE